MTQPQTPSETRTIDGFTYEVFALPAWNAVEVFQQLTRALVPALAGVAKAEGPEGLAALSGAVERMLTSLQPAQVLHLSKVLLAGARVVVNGQNVELLPIVDVHFQRRTLALWKVLAFAVEVNFPDFLAPLRGIAGRLAVRAKSALEPTPTASISTGPVGA